MWQKIGYGHQMVLAGDVAAFYEDEQGRRDPVNIFVFTKRVYTESYLNSTAGELSVVLLTATTRTNATFIFAQQNENHLAAPGEQ